MRRGTEEQGGGLFGAVALSHFFLGQRLRPGDRAVDATCGNGGDTLFLARGVGEGGRVWGFDLQETALRETASLLEKEGVLGRVELVPAGHERMREFVAQSVRCIVFNLGYLPGAKDLPATRPDTTLTALRQGEELLEPGGIIVVCIYTGHPGGAGEGEAVERWGEELDPRRWNVWRCRQANRSAAAPYLLVAEKARP